MYIASKTLWTVVLSIFFVHCTVVTASQAETDIQQPVPLDNLKNTCYLNAMLQCLLRSPLTDQLRPFLVQFARSKINPCPRESITAAYFEFLNEYLPETYAPTPALMFPTKINDTVQSKREAYYSSQEGAKRSSQEDPMVAFQAILENILNNAFLFSMTDITTQPSRSNSQTWPATVLMLATSQEKTASVEDLIKAYFTPEKQGSAILTHQISSLPKALALQIIRAPMEIERKLEIDGQTITFKDNDINKQTISVPPALDLGILGIVDKIAAQAGTKYDLFGCTLFSGTLSGGHYIAQVRYGTQWYECNDEQITKISGPYEHNKFMFATLFYENTSIKAPAIKFAPAQANRTPQRQPSTAAPHTDVNQALARFNSQLTELTRMVAQRS